MSSKLRSDARIVLRWFTLNSMAPNTEKFQVMFLGIRDNVNISFELNGIKSFGTNSIKLLGVAIDHKLVFSTLIEAVCIQASQNIKALIRIRRYLTFTTASALIRAFVLSRFFYCPIIWMFCSKSSLNKLNKVHRRALCALYKI